LAEMAIPGTSFEGFVSEPAFLRRPEILRFLNWKEAPGAAAYTEAANAFAARVLDLHRRWAEQAGLASVARSVETLDQRRKELEASGDGCLICLGWGAGLPAKAANPDASDPLVSRALRSLPVTAGALRTGLPFPKTRRILFSSDQPAALPGWAALQFEPC